MSTNSHVHNPDLSLGEIIRALRKRLSMNQTEFGVVMGVSVHAVHQWEVERHEPRPEAAARICQMAEAHRQFELAQQFARLANISDKALAEVASARTTEIYSVPEGMVAMEWPGSLSLESFEEISAWMELLKRKIKRGVILTISPSDAGEGPKTRGY